MKRYEIFAQPESRLIYRASDHQSGAGFVIDPQRGGILTGFEAGRRVFYMNEATYRDTARYVRGGNPVLFPSLGKMPDDCFFFQEKPHTIPVHGLARNLPWTVEELNEQEDARIVLRLDSPQAVLAQYPFPFSLRFAYSLQDRTLRIQQTYQNKGDQPMPVCFGFHPYFFLYKKDTARIRLAAEQCLDMITGTACPATDRIDDSREICLLYTGVRDRQALILDNGDTIRISFSEEFRNILVWSLPGEPFVCVEPWSARPNALNTGEDLLWIGPGEEISAEVCYSVE